MHSTSDHASEIMPSYLFFRRQRPYLVVGFEVFRVFVADALEVVGTESGVIHKVISVHIGVRLVFQPAASQNVHGDKRLYTACDG